LRFPGDNFVMTPKPTDSDLEFEELVEHVLAGKNDSEVVRRARERGDALRKEMRKKYGHRKIAVKLIQEVRDDE
jgi:hypothetical protein